MDRNWRSLQSWGIEFVSGFLLVGLVALVTRNEYAAPLVALLASLVYETQFDRTGWSLADFVQRAVGIGIGTLAFSFLY